MNKEDSAIIVAGYENFKHSERCEGCDKCTNPDISPPTYEPTSTDCNTVNPGRITVEPKMWTDVEGDGIFNVQVGTKNDTEKTRLDLMPCEALEQIGRAFTHGAKKYGDYNYRQGINYSRLYGAVLRHLNAYWGGEDIDEDSGLPHLALAGAEICMLIASNGEHDDRYRKEN